MRDQGGVVLGGQEPFFWGTPKLHKRGGENVAIVCANRRVDEPVLAQL